MGRWHNQRRVKVTIFFPRQLLRFINYQEPYIRVSH